MTFTNSLHILFDIGVILSFIPSLLIEMFHLYTFPFNAPFSMTSLLGRLA